MTGLKRSETWVTMRGLGRIVRVALWTAVVWTVLVCLVVPLVSAVQTEETEQAEEAEQKEEAEQAEQTEQREQSQRELTKISAQKAEEQDPEADVAPREALPEYLDDLGLPMPCSGPYDWIRLDSGEWLRGRVYRMRRNVLEYRSKKLKKQTVKWKDVSELCLPEPTRFVLERRRVVIGRARLRGDDLTVTGRDGNREFERGSVVAILPGDRTELNRWRAKASIGIDAKTGNTNQSLVSSAGEVVREDRLTRGQLLYDGSIGASGGEENVNTHRGEAKLDVFVSRHLYVTAVDTTFRHDKFQNLDFQATPTTGLGWSLFDRPSFEWDIEGGGGYQYTSYIGGAPDEGNGVIRLGTRFYWDLITDLKLNIRHDTVLVVSNFDLTNYHTRAVFSYEITDLFNLEFTLVHDRVRQPVADGDRVPEQDDVQMIFSLAVEYR